MYRGVDSTCKNEYQDIPGGKGGRCVRLRILPLSCADCLEIWEPQPPGRRSVTRILYLYLYTLAEEIIMYFSYSLPTELILEGYLTLCTVLWQTIFVQLFRSYDVAGIHK